LVPTADRIRIVRGREGVVWLKPPLLLKAGGHLKGYRLVQAGRRLSHAEGLKGAEIKRVAHCQRPALNNALKPTACRVSRGGAFGLGSVRQAAAYLGR